MAEFIASVCAAGGAPRKTCLRLTLLIEELFTNTVVHGHGQDSEAPINLTVDVGIESIALTYEDTAPPHNPFELIRRPDDAMDVDERPVGGLGVLLVATIARDVEYRHAEGKNHIRLVVNTPA